MEVKQAAFRERAGWDRLSVVTLKASDQHRASGMTPALSDNFLHIDIDGDFFREPDAVGPRMSSKD